MTASTHLPHSESTLTDNETSRDDRTGALVAEGCAHERSQDWEAAIAAYQEAIQLQSQHPLVRYFAHNNLGYSLLQLGRFDLAATHCEAAIFVDPHRHNAHKNLGLAREGQRRWLEAALSLTEAARRCPQDRRAWLHLQKLLATHAELLGQSETLAAEIADLQDRYAASGAPPRLN